MYGLNRDTHARVLRVFSRMNLQAAGSDNEQLVAVGDFLNSWTTLAGALLSYIVAPIWEAVSLTSVAR